MASWISADWPAPDTVVAGTTLRGGRFEDLPLKGRPCWLKQVHGAEVVAAPAHVELPEADGSVSESPEQICVIRTADCLPVLFCSNDGAVVAAAHAGWRGLAAGVIENALAGMNTDPGKVLAWLGPAISQPSFEVGDEVKAAFEAHDPAASACFEHNSRGRWQADLYGLARQRLTAAGVTRIYGGGFCTFQDSERFYSYRRDPDCGRMVSFVARTAP